MLLEDMLGGEGKLVRFGGAHALGGAAAAVVVAVADFHHPQTAGRVQEHQIPFPLGQL
jgi:hypothetical protein